MVTDRDLRAIFALSTWLAFSDLDLLIQFRLLFSMRFEL